MVLENQEKVKPPGRCCQEMISTSALFPWRACDYSRATCKGCKRTHPFSLASTVQQGERMSRTGIGGLLLALIATAGWATTAWGHYTSGVEHVGERTASFLASPFVAAFDPAPVLYRQPLAPYPTDLPPGMCRWERFILDSSGRPLFDPNGNPLKEYTVGPCTQPPPY